MKSLLFIFVLLFSSVAQAATLRGIYVSPDQSVIVPGICLSGVVDGWQGTLGTLSFHVWYLDGTGWSLNDGVVVADLVPGVSLFDTAGNCLTVTDIDDGIGDDWQLTGRVYLSGVGSGIVIYILLVLWRAVWRPMFALADV